MRPLPKTPSFKPSLSRQLSPNPNLSPSQYNSLLLSHLRSGDPTSTLLLFQRMRSLSVPLDPHSFPPVLSACSLLRLPSLSLQLHSLLTKSLPPSPSPLPLTSLLSLYSRLGLSFLPLALSLFDQIPNKDPVAFNALISSLLLHSRPHLALLAFRSMLVDHRLPPTDSTLSSALKACAFARTLRPGRQLHARILVSGRNNSLAPATSLVRLYFSCRLVSDATQVFLRTQRKDAAIHNAFLSGLISNRRYGEAFAVLREMRPNAVALTACSETSNLAYGREVHCVAVRNGFDDTMLANGILDMYAKCGEINAVRAVFDRIRGKNVASWTIAVDAYGSQGLGAEALRTFERVEGGDVLPNDVTFLSVLSACGHSGMVEEGGRCFFSMKHKYGIDPGPEHHACYIDMLGRAGRIDEAWDVFRGVGELTSGVCVAMLNACRVCSDLTRGEVVARRLLELDSENPGIYVLLSNFYADVGKWDGVEDLRKAMRVQGLRKETASSSLPA